jgi:hypothetical protein
MDILRGCTLHSAQLLLFVMQIAQTKDPKDPKTQMSPNLKP